MVDKRPSMPQRKRPLFPPTQLRNQFRLTGAPQTCQLMHNLVMGGTILRRRFYPQIRAFVDNSSHC